MRLGVLRVSAICLLAVPGRCWGQMADSPTDSGDLAWMLCATALMLFLTAPGLAMFYGGQVRRKNVLAVMMQCSFLMALMSLTWVVCGYSLAFGGQGGWYGNLDHVWLRGLLMQEGRLPGDRVPALVHAAFQGMFFAITPALICGAFAERMRFGCMALFSVAWGLLVYCPLCHMIWDQGCLHHSNGGAWLGGAMDFAGGTLVHVSSGFAALACALVVGRRLGYGSEDMRPHNLTYTAIGVAMLWFGWLGLCAGNAGGANDLAAHAFVVTHLAASSGAVAWTLIERRQRGRATVLGTATGALSGLVCITPGCGFVQPPAAILMGAAAGVVCCFACTYLRPTLRYDDSLDVFSVHGIGGVLGALLTGLFATRDVNPLGHDGLLYGGSWLRLAAQSAAVVLALGLSLTVSFVLLKLIDATWGLRVSQASELRGLDLAEHGEEGYILTN